MLRTSLSTGQILIVGGVALVVLVGAALLLPDQAPPQDTEPPVVAGYPLPPLDLTVPPRDRIPDSHPRKSDSGDPDYWLGVAAP